MEKLVLGLPMLWALLFLSSLLLAPPSLSSDDSPDNALEGVSSKPSSSTLARTQDSDGMVFTAVRSSQANFKKVSKAFFQCNLPSIESRNRRALFTSRSIMRLCIMHDHKRMSKDPFLDTLGWDSWMKNIVWFYVTRKPNFFFV